MKETLVVATLGIVLGGLFGIALRISAEEAERIEKEAERLRRQNDDLAAASAH